LLDSKRIKHNQLLIDNFKSKLSGHVTGQWFSKLMMAKDIMCTFAFNQSLGSIREATRFWELTKRTSKKVLKDVWCWTHHKMHFAWTTRRPNNLIRCLNIRSNLWWLVENWNYLSKLQGHYNVEDRGETIQGASSTLPSNIWGWFFSLQI
jgi:hypothetical protein